MLYLNYFHHCETYKPFFVENSVKLIVINKKMYEKSKKNCLQKSSKFQKQLFVVLLYVFRKQSYSLWTNDGISDVHRENQNQTLRLKLIT